MSKSKTNALGFEVEVGSEIDLKDFLNCKVTKIDNDDTVHMEQGEFNIALKRIVKPKPIQKVVSQPGESPVVVSQN